MVLQGGYSVLPCPTTQNGKTPLMRAAKWGYNDIIQELLKYGVGVNIQDRVSQRPCTLLHVCVVYSVVCFAFGI